VLAPPAEAQSGELRVRLDQFRNTLTGITDPHRLRDLEQGLAQAETAPETEAMRRLQRGWVRLRLGTLGDGPSLGRAADDFARATELEPGWSAAWQGRGLALRVEGDRLAADPLNLGKRVGFGPVEDAVESFGRALQIDPLDAVSGLALYEAAALLRDTTRFVSIVLPALRRAAKAGSRDTALLLALGRAERLVGDPHAAMDAARAYLEQGGSPGLGLHELAWSRFLAGDAAADSAYYAGAALEDSAGAAAYRADLALIAPDSTLRELDQSRGARRAEFLRRFWLDHGRQALRSGCERLREHYRRISFAERHYGLEVNRRYFSDSDMYRSGSDRFDDRGVVYIRYGEPDAHIGTVTWGIQPNETWAYHRADGDLLLHFAANLGGDLHDYRLVPSVTAVGGVDHGAADNPAAFFAFNDRCAIYPPYCKFLSWGPYGRTTILNREHILVEASVNQAVTTEDNQLRFSRPVQATAAAFAVGREEGHELLHLAYEVSLVAPPDLPAGTVFRRATRVRVNLYDVLGRSVGWLDTTTALLFPGGDPERGIVKGVGRIVMPAPTGQWRYRMALAFDDSTGSVFPSDSISVGEFDGARLALSDLVLSRGGWGAPWIPAEGDTAFFNPRRRWARSDTIALYHEIYGLDAGAGYTARLVVRRGRSVALTFRWQGEATGKVTRVTRTLSFATVRPGAYQLEIEVTSPNGEQARSARSIEITE
jgi:GWxTD domain-containing protein